MPARDALAAKLGFLDGVDRLGDRVRELRERYGEEPHPGACKIARWLDGGYLITDEVVQTQ